MSPSAKRNSRGDFNAYTSNEPDFIQFDNSFSLLDDISYSEDVTPPIRSNSDLRPTNNYGRKLLQSCIASGLRICNGRYGSDAGIGESTCFSSGKPSLIDYILSDPSMASYITDLSVDNRTESIHMPVYIELKGRTRRQITTADVPPQEMSENLVKLMWNDTFKQQYINNMIESLDSIFSPFNEALDRNDVNSAVDILNSCFYQSGSTMQPRSDRPRPKPPFASKPNRWFNQTCAFLRANVIQKLRYLAAAVA
ncbi:hypothetical protein ACF0H5_009444 [Mactra antiquata]